MTLRDKIFCEEVEDCPVNENMALFEVGCTDKGDNIFLVCQRDADINALTDWLADMICEDCTHMCVEAQKHFDCCYFGRDFTAIADMNAELMGF